jgi:hypothetical protein
MPIGWPIVPPPNCSTHVVAEQVEQLVHLAGMDAAGGHRQHLLQVGPVLLEEDAALQVDSLCVSRQML